MKTNQLYIVLISIFMLPLIANSQQIEDGMAYKLLTTETEFEAGKKVILKFSTKEDTLPLLYISNSYGSCLVNAKQDWHTIQYTLPQHFYNKAGVTHWKLLIKETSLTGDFTILPKQQVAQMETYIGPPSINSGGTDHSMLVVIPTDNLDNPIATNTPVNVAYQFLINENKTTVQTNNLIAYKNIYSLKESGRILVSSECLEKNSKEFTINVMPAIPSGFTITAARPHQYADGNQITTFSTSVIKDKFNNIVSNGTYVQFYITTSRGTILKTAGTTINGIANAKMIHPDYAAQWNIKASVAGMTESNVIAVNYQQTIKDFNVVFSKNNRMLKVGPLKSFMQQMIPDGLQVTLSIYQNNTLIDTSIKTSRNGFVNFQLKSDVIINGTYNLKINTAGLEKTYPVKKLW